MPFPTPPTLCHNVAGAAQIWVGTGPGGAKEFLGYTINGVNIEEQDFTSGVPSDDFGGTEGPPSDYQLFGVLHRIDLELGKFSDAVLLRVGQRANPAVNTGVANVPGMLLRCSGKAFKVAIRAPNFYRLYEEMFLLGPARRSPIGSQFTRAAISLTATASVGQTIWNANDW